MAEEDRFVLGIAFKAGKHKGIRMGADGKKDYADTEVIEKAAWQYLREGREIGIEHADGTLGHAEVVESGIYRGPDWIMKSVTGQNVTVNAGDWLIGMILDEPAWQLRKAGKLNGLSAQGRVRRRKSGTDGALMKSEMAMTFKPTDQDEDDDLSEITFMKTHRVDMVGHGANAPDFILAKSSTDPSLITEDEITRLAKSAQEGDMTATQKTAPVAPEGDEALAKAGDLEIDVNSDAVLEPPTIDADGDAILDPTSPAWEALDAARAAQAIELTIGLKRLVEQAQERETQEAIVGDDAADGDNAWSLSMVLDNLDCILSILAPFAVMEAAEAEDRATEDSLMLKSGRVLSGVNEARVQQAHDLLGEMLASVQTAPVDDTLAKGAAANEEDEKDETVDEVLEKASGDPQVLVYGPEGATKPPLGSVDPKNLTVFAVPPATDADGDAAPAAAPDAPAEDTPAETAADAATTDGADAAVAAAPAQEPADPADAAVIPGTDTVQAPAPDDTEDVKKGQIAAEIRTALGEVLEPLLKKAANYDGLEALVKGLQDRVEMIGRTPDDSSSPRLNGATGAGAVSRDSEDPLEMLRKSVAENPGDQNMANQLLNAELRARFAR